MKNDRTRQTAFVEVRAICEELYLLIHKDSIDLRAIAKQLARIRAIARQLKTFNTLRLYSFPTGGGSLKIFTNGLWQNVKALSKCPENKLLIADTDLYIQDIRVWSAADLMSALH